jgi:hydrogenase maturation protein HypF
MNRARPRHIARITERHVRRRVFVDGIVQGVGLRPFVYSLAAQLRLGGRVGNDARGVVIEIEGNAADAAEFLARLRREAPPLASIEAIHTVSMPPVGATEFVIAESQHDGERSALISPDIATCEACLTDLFTPTNRRFLYPFTNCTNCGPRFTIVRGVPYDRPLTTMAGFPMCPDCTREYHDPRNRRFHAQPISCPSCGPRLQMVDRSGTPQSGDPIQSCAAALRAGYIVAVKGLGGYHLAVAATLPHAVAALRGRKHREERPFAVMARDLATARRLAEIDADEARLLTSARRPIVLLRRRADAPLADAVAPGNRFVGIMLPYTPLHHLLGLVFGEPIVLTSGNVSDEPIAYADDDAFARLDGIADYFLTHDRPIHIRTDDSVTRVFRGAELLVRRSRGSAPQPLALPWRAPRPILACGGELKNTFCLVKDAHAFISHHIGDLENFQTLQAFRDGIAHLRRLFDVEPQVVAYDLHPEYLSTKFALQQSGVELVGVQHHHAHIAACLAENEIEQPAIGVAFDGLGYGLDGTLWGGEFLIADLAECERVGHFEPVPMPGGTSAIRQPWRMAAAYLDAAFGGSMVGELALAERHREHWSQVVALARMQINAPLTSSVGRLFDAVAAIVGVRDVARYEGQAAIELEQLADRAERGLYRTPFDQTVPCRLPGPALVRAVVDDLRAGTAPAIVAARFHNAVAALVVEVCCAVRAARGLSLVALSGGVFQNLLLLERTVDGLEQHGFRVLRHSRVPPNDGGISYGQAVVAAARLRRAARQPATTQTT